MPAIGGTPRQITSGNFDQSGSEWTMLMTGVNDLRTPMPQTEQFYSALKLRKVPTAMVRFVDEWHGTTSKPSNFMRTQLYLRYWFGRHKRGTEHTTAIPSEER